MMQYDAMMQELVRELGLDRLPEDKQQQLLAQMGEVLMKRIFLETLEKLAEAGKDEEYEQFMEKQPTQEEAEAFLTTHIPGYAEMVEGIVADFKNEMKKDL